MKTIYLIDGNSFFYRAFFATPYLANSKGIPTNATYAFTNMIRKLLKERGPSFLVCVFDSKKPSFRAEISKAYKAQRPPMPTNLSVQIPYIRAILEAMGIGIIERDGFEADDLICSIVKTLKGEGRIFYIVTNDKDMMQIVDDDVLILDTMKDRIIGRQEVIDKFGVSPEFIPDFLALTGDDIDNIPGVPGIGEKWARALIKRFGYLEKIYENIEKIESPSLREKLEKGKELAFLSKTLAIIRTDVPILINEEDLRIKEADKRALKRLYKELEFTNLLKELKEEGEESERQTTFIFTEIAFSGIKENVSLIPVFRGQGYNVDLEAFALFDGEGYYYSNSVEEFLSLFCSKRRITVHNLKPVLTFLKKKGITDCENVEFFDAMLAQYLINPLKRDYGLDCILEEELETELKPHGGKQNLFLKAFLLSKLISIQRQKINELSLSELFYRIEMPLIDVLSSMEFYGVKVDREVFSLLSKEYEEKIGYLEKRIFEISKKPFNINSQKQLSHILFDVLGLPTLKKTKTGYSTDLEVLMELSKKHEIARLILDYRALSKLKSTYIDALPSFINEETGRIHAKFDQTVAATGRIISSDPNLQNIPIRGEEGRRIRSAFVAENGYQILSSDYSQIELRILAHISKDDSLIEAFLKDEDIHRKVAQEIFNVKAEEINEDLRRIAKTVNFGIVYGMSSFGLSKELNISQKEAHNFIEGYFQRHRGVREYIESTVNEANEKGFVRTLFGRIRFIPEIHNPDPNIRQFGERTAVNTPIQGTAADIIKLAMINIHRRIKEAGLTSRLIIQIHDELVFEVKEEELKLMKEIVEEEMENVVSLSVPLKVNLGVGKNWAEAHA